MANDGLEPYEEFYYGYQTVGRGLVEPEQLRTAFKALERQYDELFEHVLKGTKGRRALDIGCGYGNFLWYLSLSHDAVGIDLDPAQIALAKSVGLNAVVADAVDYLETSEGVDIVSAFDLIEHLSKNRAVDFVRLVHKKLSTGGLFILQCPCADGFSGAHDICNDLTHKWGASSNMLSQFLKTAGFSEVQIIDPTMLPNPKGLRSRVKHGVRKVARKIASPLMGILGVQVPRVWAPSQVAIARK